MALETKPAKDPAAEDKHELDPKRKAALDTALAQVEKSFGKGSAMRLGDQPEQNVEVIPTGSLALDMALGIGGLPKGSIVEIYGPESSGKTTLALHVVANAQKKGGVSAYIDAEHVFFQMDVYWVVRGQNSPVDYFNKYPGRFTMLHIKDHREIGQSGMVGYDAIFKNTDTAGVRHIVAEIEKYSCPVEESVKQSLDYLLDAPFVKASYSK